MDPEPAQITGFHLSCELRGHDADVRGVDSCAIGILTSSRDKTLKLWTQETPTSYANTSTYVSDLCLPLCCSPNMAPPTTASSGGMVSGSRDKTVVVWDIATAAPIVKLEGHTYQVTALGLLPSGEIVSASLDKTLKVWREGKCVNTLSGHDGPVLSLIVMPDTGEILSGSGDTNIKVWSNGKCSKTITGHTDTVRALALLPVIGFVSGSHDLTVKVWTQSGDIVAELLGHTAIIFSVAATHNGLIASGSDDNTVRLWQTSGECLQILEHPGCIWDLSFMDDGALISGCADAVARIWSSKPECKADLALIATFESNMTQLPPTPAHPTHADPAFIASFKANRAELPPTPTPDANPTPTLTPTYLHHLPQIPQADPALIARFESNMAELKAGAAKAKEESEAGGGGDLALPPGVKVEEASSLLQPGAKDGQTKIVKETNGAVNAYSWDSQGFQWEKIGEVCGAPAGPVKKMHLGKEWDFVFDVDFADDTPVKKLPYDMSENPYIAAARFLEMEDLPLGYKDQIVAFILENSGQNKPTANFNNMPVTGGFCDPFTGGDSSMSEAPSGSQRPQMAPPPPLDSLPVTGGGIDPISGGAGGGARGQMTHVPATVFMVFDNTPPAETLARKLREFNSALAQSTPPAALSETELGAPLDALLDQLPAAAAASSSGSLSPDQLALAAKLLAWPAQQLFPALDIARCVALHPGGAAAMVSGAGPMGGTAAQSGSVPAALSIASVAEPAIFPNQQLGLRLACNMFKQASTRAWVVANRAAVLDAFVHCCHTTNKGVRVSMATLLYNFVILSSTPGSLPSGEVEEAKMQMLSALSELLTVTPLSDIDSTSVPWSLWAPCATRTSACASLAKDLGVQDLLKKINDSPEAKTAAGRKLLEAAIDVSIVFRS
eukprot:gene25625-11281_t